MGISAQINQEFLCVLEFSLLTLVLPPPSVLIKVDLDLERRIPRRRPLRRLEHDLLQHREINFSSFLRIEQIANHF